MSVQLLTAPSACGWALVSLGDKHISQRGSPPSLGRNTYADFCVALLPAQSAVYAVRTCLPPRSPMAVPHRRPPSLRSPVSSVRHRQQGDLVIWRWPVLSPVWGAAGWAPTLGAVWGFGEEQAVGGRGAQGAGAQGGGGGGDVAVHRYIQQRGEGTGRKHVA